MQVLSPEPVTDLQEFGVPEVISRVVMRALSKSSGGRWPAIVSMARELEPLMVLG